MSRDIQSELEAEKSRLRAAVIREEEHLYTEVSEKVRTALTIGGTALVAGGLAVLIGRWLSSDEGEGIEEQESHAQEVAVTVPDYSEQAAVLTVQEEISPHPLWNVAKKELTLFLLEAAKEELIILLDDLMETTDNED